MGGQNLRQNFAILNFRALLLMYVVPLHAIYSLHSRKCITLKILQKVRIGLHFNGGEGNKDLPVCGVRKRRISTYKYLQICYHCNEMKMGGGKCGISTVKVL